MSPNTAIEEHSFPATAPVGRNCIAHEMQNQPVTKTQGFAAVNGLSMYYEIEGAGKPLVYIPMGFGVAGTTKFPTLTRDRMLISLDLQGRGRTADIDRPLSYEQQADDVIALLQHLRIGHTDLLGECVGGIVATLIAMRRPDLVGRVITYGTVFGQFPEAYKPEILAHVMSLTPDSEVLRFQRDRYERVAPDPAHWSALWAKFNGIQWQGFASADLCRVQAPVLVAVGDHDWVRLEHSLDIYRLFRKGELAVIPDAGHFALDAEQEKLLPLFEGFLNAPEIRLPFATTAVGYERGFSR
jgi:pimeloyl-ACP methyl ester carboxylesterase